MTRRRPVYLGPPDLSDITTDQRALLTGLQHWVSRHKHAPNIKLRHRLALHIVDMWLISLINTNAPNYEVPAGAPDAVDATGRPLRPPDEYGPGYTHDEARQVAEQIVADIRRAPGYIAPPGGPAVTLGEDWRDR